jgi:predicted AlkP superfamily pyrophosphatase or phosphodiesterase
MRPGIPLLALLLALLARPPLQAGERPRLVVQLIFDQMRGDYLGRWQDLFVEGGFRRLTGEGVWFQECHYPFAYTMTGPGHATLSTGCPPETHGIIGNEWYDRKLGDVVNCVSSERFEQIPPRIRGKDDKKKDVYGASPRRLLAPTLADAIKDQLGDAAKVVCLSLKDRSSVLPGGTRPDACYWLDKYGRVATSTYYRDHLHAWAKEFNASGYVEQWRDTDWHHLRCGVDYDRRAGPDDVKGEGKGAEQGRTFPHPLGDGPKKKPTNYYEALATSPFGNDVLLELAKRAIEAEKLGRHDTPDFLSLSFSSNDLVGHAWGPDSQEVLDVTLRSDVIVRDLLAFLDEKVGKGKYLVALTADHGICPLPEVSRTKGLPARRVDLKKLLKKAEEHLDDLFPPADLDSAGKGKWVESSGLMLYVNRRRVAVRETTVEKVEAALTRWLSKQPGVAAAVTREELLRDGGPAEFAESLRLSYYPERSGDVMLLPRSHCLLSSSYLAGTTHGSPYAYDTHVPLVVMGTGVTPAVRKDRVSPEHLAVLLARSLGIKPPAKARVTAPEGVFAE